MVKIGRNLVMDILLNDNIFSSGMVESEFSGPKFLSHFVLQSKILFFFLFFYNVYSLFRYFHIPGTMLFRF